MSVSDGAAVASAVVAFLSMLGAGYGWSQARKEKSAAAGHERKALKAAEDAANAAKRSADAVERAAAAQEAIAAETTASTAADLEAPWSFSRDGGIAWLLHNRLGRRAYGVELSGHPNIMKDTGAVDKVDGYSAHRFMVVSGENDPLIVTWHWREDRSDDVPPWTGLLPR